jgi:hypothetical protein
MARGSRGHRLTANQDGFVQVCQRPCPIRPPPQDNPEPRPYYKTIGTVDRGQFNSLAGNLHGLVQIGDNPVAVEPVKQGIPEDAQQRGTEKRLLVWSSGQCRTSHPDSFVQVCQCTRPLEPGSPGSRKAGNYLNPVREIGRECRDRHFK